MPLNIDDFINLFPTFKLGQKINHFPGSNGLGNKACCSKNVDKLRIHCRRVGLVAECDFVPASFVIPGELGVLKSYADSHPDYVFISKPVNSSCGRGIRLLRANQISNIKPKTVAIVQRYLESPYLGINNTKFDLRVYFLVTSFDPLVVYRYEEGLVRFATEPYTLQKDSLKNTKVHLTNYSINKHSNTFVKNTEAFVDGVGSKWSHSALRARFEKDGIDHAAVFARIDAVAIKTLIAVETPINFNLSRARVPQDTCFEIFGFDIMLDKDLKAWLIEVNVCPSLSSSSPMDKRIKSALMSDTFNIIGFKAELQTAVLMPGVKPAGSSTSSGRERALALQKFKNGSPLVRHPDFHFSFGVLFEFFWCLSPLRSLY
jgi:tubulin polyglutamylase TTLL4